MRTFSGTALRTARRGVSVGISGLRNEFLRVCLDDDLYFDALFDVGAIFARGEIPSEISGFFKLTRLTALLKPNGRIRGISSGDTFRRLVSKTIARQKQTILRKLVEPFNFGLCHRGGTDALVHLIRFLLDEDPTRVLLSIDGVGAFDHVCRARIFEELRAHDELRDLIPFVTMWYGTASLFYWRDQNGTTHEIRQGDGGEQGDALMPGLFCLAMRRALINIQASLPDGAFVFAYLDDIYIICQRDDTTFCFESTRHHLKTVCHIDVHLGKLAAWSPCALPIPRRILE